MPTTLYGEYPQFDGLTGGELAREAWDRGEGFCWTRHDIEIIMRGIDEAIADLGPDSGILEMLKEKRRAFAEAING